MKYFASLLLVVLYFHATEGVFGGGSSCWNCAPKDRDCRWGLWRGKLCSLSKSGSFVMRQTRSKIAKRGKGADCKGPSKREIKCPRGEIDYISHTLLKTIGEPTITGRRGLARDLGKGHNFDGLNPCAKPFKSSKRTKMIGKKCEPKTKTRHKRQAEGGDGGGGSGGGGIKTVKNRDVLFLVDESGSVGQLNFMKEVKFAQAVAASLCGSISIGDKTTRIGITTFDLKTHDHLAFDKYFTKTAILAELGKLSYDTLDAGATCMVKALNFTREEKFTIGQGSRMFDADSERLVIMITDGCANCEGENDKELQDNLKYAAKALSNKKISVLSVYIAAAGSQAQKEKCMNNMAALADGSHCYQVFQADSWKTLDGMTESIKSADCMDAWTIGETCG